MVGAAPQRIALRDVTLVGARGDDEVFRAELGERAYSIRVINTQADLALDLALTHLGADGKLNLEAVWDWAHSALQLDAEIDALDLDALTQLARPYSDRVALTGTLGLDTTFNQRIDRSIRTFEAARSTASPRSSTGRTVAESASASSVSPQPSTPSATRGAPTAHPTRRSAAWTGTPAISRSARPASSFGPLS